MSYGREDEGLHLPPVPEALAFGRSICDCPRRPADAPSLRVQREIQRCLQILPAERLE